MAIVYPTATGAYSTRTWNNDATGAAYGMAPQVDDTVLANGLAITLDTDITVADACKTEIVTAAMAATEAEHHSIPGLFRLVIPRVVQARWHTGPLRLEEVSKLEIQSQAQLQMPMAHYYYAAGCNTEMQPEVL
jgi:hypothetical protein